MNAAELDQVFRALGDPTRRAIVERLSRSDASVSELAEPHAMSLPAISKHLRVLEGAGLVRKAREGKTIICTLSAQPMQQATRWLEEYRRFWEASLDGLESFLEETKPKVESTKRKKSKRQTNKKKE